MKLNKSLKFKLLFFCTLSVLLLSAGFITYSVNNTKNTLVKHAEENLENITNEAAFKVKVRFDSAFATVKDQLSWLVSSLNETSQIKTDETTISQIFKEILLARNDIFGVWVEWELSAFDKAPYKYQRKTGGTKHPRFITYWTRNIKGELSEGASADNAEDADNSYYTIPLNKKEEVAIEPYEYPVDGVNVLMTSLTKPIMKSGDAIGVVGVDLDLKSIQTIAEEFKIYDGAGEVIIVSNTGLVAGWSGHPEKVNKLYKEGMQNLTAHLLELSEKDQHAEDGNFLSVSQFKIGEAKDSWFVISKVPQDVIYAPIYQMARNQIIGGIFFALIILAVAYVFVNSVSNRLTQTTQRLNELAQETEKTSQKVKLSSEKVNSGSTENASSIHETVTALHQIKSMVDQNVDKAKTSEKAVEEGVHLAHVGGEDINKMMDSMHQIEESSNKMFTQFKHNSDELNSIINLIQQIADKAKVINDIVFQTKLLSFNASVEAARAGEMGKGFSVVAEEVGNLAQMSGNAAKEIEDLLKKSSSEVKRIVESSVQSIESLTGETSQKINSGLTLAEQCVASFNKIETTVGSLKDMIAHISRASSEQSEGVNNISIAMERISQVSEENRVASDETNLCSEEMFTQSKHLFDCTWEIEKEVLGEVKKAA